MNEMGPLKSATPRRDELVRKGLKIAHLRLLCALKETGQMGAAAAQLAISQPAASRLAADLERIVGVPLHTRHSRGIELTSNGERLAAYAGTMLQGLDDTAREISELDVVGSGDLSVRFMHGDLDRRWMR